MKHWPFNVINEGGRPKFQVKYNGEHKKFSPEEVSAMLLTKIKENAEAYLGKPILDAVVTVPACFNSAQRQATKDAGRIAGINILRLVSNTAAAAIAHRLQNKVNTIL